MKSLALNFFWSTDVESTPESVATGAKTPLFNFCMLVMSPMTGIIRWVFMIPVTVTMMIRTATNLWLDVILWENVFWRSSFDTEAPIYLEARYECRVHTPYQYMSESSKASTFSDEPPSSMYTNANYKRLNLGNELCHARAAPHKCGCDNMGSITSIESLICILVLMLTVIVTGIARLKPTYPHAIVRSLDRNTCCITLIVILSIPTPIYMTMWQNGILHMHDPHHEG